MLYPYPKHVATVTQRDLKRAYINKVCEEFGQLDTTQLTTKHFAVMNKLVEFLYIQDEKGLRKMLQEYGEKDNED